MGTSGTLIATIESRLRRDVRSYLDHELPAIAVKVIDKRQDKQQTLRWNKFYEYVCQIITRGGDLNAEVNTAQEILSHLETVMGAQYSPGSNLYGLGTHSLVRGGPIVRVLGSDIGFRNNPGIGLYEVVSLNRGEVEIIMD